MKKIPKLLAVAAILLAGCLACERNVVVDDEETDGNSAYFEDENDYVWDSLTATRIYLNGDEVEIVGQGAVFRDNQIMIQQSGDYLLKGDLSDGQIIVEAADLGRVRLQLDNVAIRCSNNTAIFITQTERAVILLKNGSENTVSDGSSYISDLANAAIYSKSDLVISGNGKLTVNGNYKDGITSKDGLIINSGEYDVTAADDGIRGKDYLVIHNGIFNITSGDDALKSDNETTGFGTIDITYGEFTIDAKGDGIYAFSDLVIHDGVFDIACSGYATSGKALKAGSLIQIGTGLYTLQSIDDGVHSDQDITITDGTFDITTQDDGFHAENMLNIEYADITINRCYEGLEAKTLTIKDGFITLTASDDGLNTASGAGAAMGGFQPGASGDNNLEIDGGTIVVWASGDGIDINGSVHMTGGSLIVHGPTANDNGAIDYDGTFVMDGGLLIAAGSSGMAQTPGTSSSQNSLLINFENTYSANTLFELQDESGKNIITFSPDHNYQSIAFSSPDLEQGTSYSIYTGGSSTGTEFAGLYSDGSYTPGNLYDSFTITSVTTIIGTSGGGPGPPGPGF